MTAEQQHISDGCLCKECYGLAEYMILSQGHDFGLQRAPRPHDRPMRLQIVTAGSAPRHAKTFAGPIVETPCTGEMICECKRCTAQVTAAVKRGGVGSGARQPWEPRPSRRAA